MHYTGILKYVSGDDDEMRFKLNNARMYMTMGLINQIKNKRNDFITKLCEKHPDFEKYLLPLMEKYCEYNNSFPYDFEKKFESFENELDNFFKNNDITHNSDYFSDNQEVKIDGDEKKYGIIELLKDVDIDSREFDNYNTENNSFIKDVNFIQIPKNLEETATYWNKLFPIGECILLASPPGQGKTLLSIEIAKEKKIRKGLYLNIDDTTGGQIYRYACLKNVFDDNLFHFGVLNTTNWKHYKKIIEEGIKKNISIEAFTMANLTFSPIPRNYIAHKKQRLKEIGIKEDKRFNNILVFEILIEQIGNTFDFVCIDTWKAFQDDGSFRNDDIDRIMSICSKKGITLLVLHHTNKKDEIVGRKDIEQKFNSVYILNEVKQSENDVTYLKLDMHKSRFIKKETHYLKRTRISNFEAQFEIMTDENEIKELSNNIEQNTSTTKSLKDIGLDLYKFVKGNNDSTSKEDANRFVMDKFNINCANLSNYIKDYFIEKDGKKINLFLKSNNSWYPLTINPEAEKYLNNKEE